MNKEMNHRIRKHVNEGIYHIARYMEILLSIIILIVIALAGIRLVLNITEVSVMNMDTEFFTEFLAHGLSLVVGVEFVKMLCLHSTQAVVEVLMFATARQMVVEHMAPTQTLIGVLAIAVLFAIRKYLMTDDSDMAAHVLSQIQIYKQKEDKKTGEED